MSQSLGDVRFHRLGSQARYFSDKTPTAESYEGIKGYFRALNTECRSSTCNAFETIHLITQCREGKSKATDQFHTWLNARSTQSNKKHPKTQNCAGSEDVHKQGGISFAHIVAQGLLSATATAPPHPFFSTFKDQLGLLTATRGEACCYTNNNLSGGNKCACRECSYPLQRDQNKHGTFQTFTHCQTFKNRGSQQKCRHECLEFATSTSALI